MPVTAVRLDEVLQAPPIPGIGLTPFSPPISGHSSLSKAEERPVLSPPRRHIMLDLIDSHIETERLANKATTVFEKDVTQGLAEIDRLTTEKHEALEKEAIEAKSRATWSTLSNVAQYVAGVGTIVLGAVCGGWPGALLVASGVIGVGNRVAHDTNLLQGAVEWYSKSEEVQKRITQNIEMGAFFLQMGLGLAGGVGVWKAGTLAAAQINGADKLRTIITGAGGVMSAGSKVGIAYYDKHIAYLQARIKEIDTQTKIEGMHVSRDTTQMNEMLESVQSQTSELQKAIQNQVLQD